VNPLAGSFVILGSRVPKVVGLLIGVTLGASIVGAVGYRNGLESVVQSSALIPALVFRGQLWRVFTWFFFEMDPLALVFACIGLLLFGRDLANAWGPMRFLGFYLALGALAATLVSFLSLLWPPIARMAYIGPVAPVSGLVVVWARLFPHRDILAYFVLPLRGRTLIYVTIGGTVLFALLGGVVHFIPHFAALSLAILYMRQPFMETLWLKLRYRLNTRGWRRRGSRLRPVDRAGNEEPPKWLH